MSCELVCHNLATFHGPSNWVNNEGGSLLKRERETFAVWFATGHTLCRLLLFLRPVFKTARLALFPSLKGEPVSYVLISPTCINMSELLVVVVVVCVFSPRQHILLLVESRSVKKRTETQTLARRFETSAKTHISCWLGWAGLATADPQSNRKESK